MFRETHMTGKMSSLRTSTAILVFAFMVFIHINGKSAKHASCGRQRLNTNPMMNQTFNAGSWPWHAAIYYQKKYQCVATLISENSVVTSGHCVANDVPTEVEVRLGSSKFETAMQSFGVVKIFLHPNYNEETFNNDIAVLRLSSYAVYNEFIQPICLWPSDQTYLSEFVGKDGTVIRWEITETNEPSMSLQEVSMRIISHMDCLGSDLRPYISTTNFCARLPNDTNVSQLNSGGSLIYRGNDELYYIRGIVSVAPIFNSTRHNALFTDVARYLPWIEDMKNNCDKVVQCEEENMEQHLAKQSSFFLSYKTLCKEKGVPAMLELIRNKRKLDFVADRIKVDHWEMICKSIEYDNLLESLAIRSRKKAILDGETDSEKRPSIRPLLIRSVSGCVGRHLTMTDLALEGLPLTVDCVQEISNAISLNKSLKTLSFARSSIMDEGCNIICSAIRDLPHIEKLNLSQCFLTTAAASHISELIKFQMIKRNSEGWMKSLRYRDVDVDSVPGLKCLILNNNQICDEGVTMIASKLKEDVWMKAQSFRWIVFEAVEVQNCDVTDVGGEAILNCLEFNTTLVVFDASHNYKISYKIMKKIQMILNAESSDYYESTTKVTNSQLREKIEFLEQQLQLETFNRTRADELNIQLQKRIDECYEEIGEKSYEPPAGYKIIQSSVLNALYKDFIPFHKEVSNSQEASYKASSKLDEDVMTLNSDDGEHLIGHKRNSDSKEYLELCQFQEQIFVAPSKKCFVPGCFNEKTKKREKNLFWSPSDFTRKPRKQLWMFAVGRQVADNTKFTVCQDHFDMREDVRDYRAHDARPVLHDNAVPHNNLRNDEGNICQSS
ncbi:Protein Cep78 like [Pseudolycoriella hygida]|uniref:Protein Cep78 like n=1 Tax=Pseudolycoriella hygida TaxID=35572 RepID=A0A9Q0RZU4_9DIPT|nr:Protein Cep78 like [Pseudolycoriella hygida]